MTSAPAGGHPRGRPTPALRAARGSPLRVQPGLPVREALVPRIDESRRRVEEHLAPDVLVEVLLPEDHDRVVLDLLAAEDGSHRTPTLIVTRLDTRHASCARPAYQLWMSRTLGRRSPTSRRVPSTNPQARARSRCRQRSSCRRCGRSKPCQISSVARWRRNRADGPDQSHVVGNREGLVVRRPLRRSSGVDVEIVGDGQRELVAPGG